MTREELREKAIEKLGIAIADETTENEAIKKFMEVSSMYSFYLNECVSPLHGIELPFIASSMIIVGNAILESLDEESKKIANGIIASTFAVARREAVDEK